jgi:hypothetical protein
MDAQTALQVTAFERALQGLEHLTREEIVALVIARAALDDELAFGAHTENLSLETLRIVSARALVAASSHRRPPLSWLAPGCPAGKSTAEAARPVGNGATHLPRRALASLGTHMRLSNATNVPALPGAPALPSTPVVSAPALPCRPAGPAAPPAPGAPSRVF